MLNKPVTVGDSDFESEVLKADGPVIVDFWAAWCGPCKMMEPVYEEAAEEYDGKMKFAKVNVDENPEAPAKYGVRGIPTIIIYKDGNVAATKVGALTKSQLTAFIDENL